MSPRKKSSLPESVQKELRPTLEMERAAEEFRDIVEMCGPYLKDWIDTLGKAGKDGDVRASEKGIDIYLKAQSTTKTTEMNKVVEQIRALRQESLKEAQQDAGRPTPDPGSESGDRSILPDEETEA